MDQVWTGVAGTTCAEALRQEEQKAQREPGQMCQLLSGKACWGVMV